jgi:hypothetical protein
VFILNKKIRLAKGEQKMKAKNIVQVLVLVSLLMAIFSSTAQAGTLDMQNRLGKELKIELKDVTIAEALAKISQKADVNIVLSDEAAWRLPQGEATRLSVKLDGPLAESLTEMLSAFFMRYAADDSQLTIYPKGELDHILGRPTANQLEILKRIYTLPVRIYIHGQPQKTVNLALGTTVTISPLYVYEQLDNLFCKQIINTEKPDANKILDKYDLPTPVTIVQLLSEAQVTGFRPEYTRWYISGTELPGQIHEIKVVDAVQFQRVKLSQKIDVTYKNESLDKIFQDLANRGGITLTISPGCNLSNYRTSVSIQNMNAREAIEKVADIAGVFIDYKEYGEKFTLNVLSVIPKGEGKQGSKTQSSDGSGSYVGKISVPMNGGEYFIEFMLRESDLNNELKNLRKEKINDILKQYQKNAEQKQPAADSAK